MRRRPHRRPGTRRRAARHRGQHTDRGGPRRVHPGQRYPRHQPAGDRRPEPDRGRCHLHRPGTPGAAPLRDGCHLRGRDRRPLVARGAVIPDRERSVASPARGLRPVSPDRRKPVMDAIDGLPIGDYALLSDCRSAALVSTAGSVDWLCFPRFDAPAVLARILDPGAGHFTICPAGDFEASRAYADQTMVLETTFRTAAGTAVLTDAMAMGRNERGHDLGAESPGVLLRQLACTDGEIDVEVSYAPRPEFGLIHPILEEVPGGLAARGGAGRLLLSGPPGFRVDGATATARLHLSAGQMVMFALQHAPMWAPPLAAWDPGQIAVRLSDTMEGWRSWSAIHQTYEGPWRDLVHHSGRVLQALTFAPTGAIVAAPTTSLPETVGGERNWDYRYTWVRDASLTMEALWVAACPDEANKFFSFLADAAASQLHRGLDLQIMFGIGGERDLTERELPHLAGWRGSRPVRVGNGAWNQRQLDVYGE